MVIGYVEVEADLGLGSGESLGKEGNGFSKAGGGASGSIGVGSSWRREARVSCEALAWSDAVSMASLSDRIKLAVGWVKT